MDWMRAHPYSLSLAGAAIVLLCGALMVSSHVPQPAAGGVSTWNATPVVPDVPNAQSYPTAARQSSSSTSPNVASGTSTLPYLPQQPSAAATSAVQNDAAAATYDFGALVSQISASSSRAQKPAAGGSSSSGINAWDFIPTGIISIKTATNERTPAQEELFQYGNEVGSVIMDYDATHQDQAAILNASIKDRQNAAKSAAIAKIGSDLEQVGQKIAQINDIPESVSARNDSFSKSYLDIGTKLVAVADSVSGSDAGLVAAIRAYDASVNAFNTQYALLAQAFITEGVTFSSADPGSVFSFNPNRL